MLLTVVIVNYKVKYFVSQAIEALRIASDGLDCATYVVDNASEDGSVEYLRKRFPEINIIANKANVGFAKANNQAVRTSQSKYVLLLNPDTLIGKDTLQQVLRHMESHPEVGAVGVKMHDAQGNFLPESKRGSVSLWSCACRFSGLSRLFPHSRLFNAYYMGWLNPTEPHSVGLLAGAFMMLRRDAFEEVGLLDERYFMYGEDIDLSYSLRQKGYRCDYLPMPLLHYKGESEAASGDPTRYRHAFFGAMQLFYEKYHPHNKLGQWIIGRAARILAHRHAQQTKEPAHAHKRTLDDLDLLSIDLSQATKESLPYNRNLLVTLSADTYDKFLALLSESEGLGCTFYTLHKDEGYILGPGGVWHI